MLLKGGLPSHSSKLACQGCHTHLGSRLYRTPLAPASHSRQEVLIHASADNEGSQGENISRRDGLLTGTLLFAGQALAACQSSKAGEGTDNSKVSEAAVPCVRLELHLHTNACVSMSYSCT